MGRKWLPCPSRPNFNLPNEWRAYLFRVTYAGLKPPAHEGQLTSATLKSSFSAAK